MTERRTARGFRASVAAVGMLVALGCVKRTETIKIEPDGTAHLEVVFDGDLEDVRTGDAMLADHGAWDVEERIEKDDDGDEDLRRTARLTVAPGGEFPTHFAGDDHDLALLALGFSTSLDIEERPDGTYYHFRRLYHRREWARIDYFRRTFVEDELEKLDNKDMAELTAEEQRSVAQALIDLEGVKTLMLAEAAALALEPPLRQDSSLAIHRAIWQVFEAIEVNPVVELLRMEGDEAEAQIKTTVEEVHQELEQRIEQVLGASDPSGRSARAFLDQLDLERRRYAITEDLADDNFEITVELPGRIVGHNSLDGIGEVGGSSVRWEFDGKWLYDRDQILMATSVVASCPLSQ